MNPYNKNWYNLLKTTRGLPAVPTNEDERAATSKFFDEISQKYKVSSFKWFRNLLCVSKVNLIDFE